MHTGVLVGSIQSYFILRRYFTNKRMKFSRYGHGDLPQALVLLGLGAGGHCQAMEREGRRTRPTNS